MAVEMKCCPGLFGLGNCIIDSFRLLRASSVSTWFSLQKRKQGIPDGLFGQYFGIANDNNSVACASHGYVQPTWIIKKTDSLIFVGADTRHDYNIFLLILESVNASNFNILKMERVIIQY